MTDEPETPPTDGALALQDSAKKSTGYRDYTPEDKFTALAALDINGGNVYRTAIAYSIPETTLRSWRNEREANGGGPSKLEREKRGNLAAKIEDKIHSVVESITPEVIAKATLSQRSVFIGILTDKLRLLRGEGLDPDFTTELCRLLNINRSQLPETLQLAPGEELPEDFGPVIETQPSPDNPDSYEPTLETQPGPDENQSLMDSEEDDDKPAN